MSYKAVGMTLDLPICMSWTDFSHGIWGERKIAVENDVVTVTVSSWKRSTKDKIIGLWYLVAAP